MMKAMLFKELRETLPLAGLIFLITGGLLVLGVCEEFHSGLPLIERTTLTICMLMYPTAGLALGLLPMFTDLRRGRWQFVSHRPISRSQWFAGKVLVSVAVYLISTLLPLAAVVAWVAKPGHLAGPFTLGMTTPALAHLASGLMWYAVGLLVAARSARWYASRIMPVGVALIGTLLFMAFAVTFTVAIAYIFLCTLVLLLGAWGAFVSGGDPANIPTASKPWIGITVAAGWTIVVALLVGMTTEAINYLSEPRDTYTYKMYRLGLNGDIQTVTYGNNTTEPIADLSGKIIGDALVDRQSLTQTQLYVGSEEDTSTWRHARTEGFMKAESHACWITSSTKENWFYIPSRRVIEGFNQQTRGYIGSYGPDGFAPPGQTARPFATAAYLQLGTLGYHEPLMIFHNEVFFVDTQNRQIRKLFSSREDDPVLSASYLQSVDKRGYSEPDATLDGVIATRNTLHFILQNREVLTLPLEHNVPTEHENWLSMVTVGRTDAGQIVVGYGIDYPAGFEPASVMLYDMNGKFIRRTDVPAPPQPAPVQPGVSRKDFTYLPAPPAFFAGVHILHAWGDGTIFWKSFYWKTMGRLFLIAAVYGVIAWIMLRSRHASRNQKIIWIPLIAGLGVSGILLLMSMFEKPKSVRCSSCQKQRLITLAKCPHCQFPADMPAMEGIEILVGG